MSIILPKEHGVWDPTLLLNPYQTWYLCVKADYLIDVTQTLAQLIIEEDWSPGSLGLLLSLFLHGAENAGAS